MASENLRQDIVELEAIALVEDSRTLAYQEQQEEWDAIIQPASFCLRVLREPQALLSSIEPHRLDVENPWSLHDRFFNKYMQYVSYVNEPSVATGLRSLIDNIQ